MMTDRQVISVIAPMLMVLAATQASWAKMCENGAPLPYSKLCVEEAAEKMPPIDADFVDGLKLMNCKPVLQEALAVGRPLLYYGADCGSGAVILSASMGAHSGSLTKISGGMDMGNSQPVDLVTFLPSDPEAPTESLVTWARDSMIFEEVFSPEEIEKCTARRVTGTPDTWVVDEYINGFLPSSPNEPRTACGLFGYTEDSDASWRVAFGYAWFVDFGQDAYKDFDFSSLTLLPQEDRGQQTPIKPGAPKVADIVPPAVSPRDADVTNIAGGDEQLYGEVRGWKIYSAQDNGKISYCLGERNYDDVKFRLGWDGAQWQVAVQGSVRPDYYGRLEVDGSFWDMRGTSDESWIYGWLGEEELQAIRKGDLMILDIARASLDFPLIGTASSILKIQECVLGTE